MRTNRLRYLQQKLHRTLHIKSILLAILGAILLSACGIKGDLYQTPEQVITEQNTEQDKITKQRDESQEKPEKTLDEAETNSAVQQPIAQATIPAVKQSTEQIKE